MSTSIEAEIGSRQTEIKLYTYKAAVVLGVGGIGSWIALDLALSGKILNLYLVDPDIIESSNLNRTPFRLFDIDQYKVDALKDLILERRPIDIFTFKQKTNLELASTIQKAIARFSYNSNEVSNDIINNDAVIIDCRDDVFEDFYKLPFKYYKIGYDGLECTIDGNPRNTAVWGRANGYRVTPSFVCPSQLVANLIVSDLLTVKNDDTAEIKNDTIKNNQAFDARGRFNKCFTFDTREIIEILYRNSLSTQGQ